MKHRCLFTANLALLSFAITLPVMNLFALPRKFGLDAELWTGAFGYFNRVWTAYAGGVAFVALFVSLVLVIWRRKIMSAWLLSLNAVFIYAALAGLMFLGGATVGKQALAFALTLLGWFVLLGASLAVARHPTRQGVRQG